MYIPRLKLNSNAVNPKSFGPAPWSPCSGDSELLGHRVQEIATDFLRFCIVIHTAQVFSKLLCVYNSKHDVSRSCSALFSPSRLDVALVLALKHRR